VLSASQVRILPLALKKERQMKTNFDFKETEYKTEEFVKIIINDLKEFNFKTFNLGISYPNILSEDEKLILKKEFQFPLTKEVEKKTESTRVSENYDIEIIIDFNYKQIEYKIFPIYVYGIYNKYSRDLAQTKYFCFKCKGRGCSFCNFKGVLKETSLEEKISEYFKHYSKIKKCVFHGAGREDVDVLMLGNGREFIIEIENPFKREINNLDDIEEEIKKKEEEFKIFNLKMANKKNVQEIKQERHYKLYKTKIYVKEGINKEDLEKIILEKELEIIQTTPKRVEKRRANLERKRNCSILKKEILTETEIILEIKAEAGLYIKEFISSDEKRTTPSISDILGKTCQCRELDVIWIYR
jgi:tRNA pseudouridine synthase 10